MKLRHSSQPALLFAGKTKLQAECWSMEVPAVRTGSCRGFVACCLQRKGSCSRQRSASSHLNRIQEHHSHILCQWTIQSGNNPVARQHFLLCTWNQRRLQCRRALQNSYLFNFQAKIAKATLSANLPHFQICITKKIRSPLHDFRKEIWPFLFCVSDFLKTIRLRKWSWINLKDSTELSVAKNESKTIKILKITVSLKMGARQSLWLNLLSKKVN